MTEITVLAICVAVVGIILYVMVGRIKSLERMVRYCALEATCRTIEREQARNKFQRPHKAIWAK